MVIAGCGTLFTGTSDTIQFNSEPQGATVMIDGVERGTTPVEVSVSRSLNDKMVTFERDGYQDRTITLQKEFNVISILNLGNLLFWGIDAVTGAVFKYSPKQYNIEMERGNMSDAAAPDASSSYDVYTITELKRSANGSYVVPEGDHGQAIIHDVARDVAYVVK
jgi:hypothetical protein